MLLPKPVAIGRIAKTSFPPSTTLLCAGNLVNTFVEHTSYRGFLYFMHVNVNFFSLIAGHLQEKVFAKNPEVRELLFKAFEVACETRFSLEYFLVKVALFAARLTERRLFGYGFEDLVQS